MSDPTIPVKALSKRPFPDSEKGRILPLSYAQQGLWLVHQMEPDTSAYNLPLGLSLKGTLNEAALEESLREILKRHDVLRTRFIVHNGESFQEILPKLEFRLTRFDFSHWSKAQRENEVRTQARNEAQKSFDLRQAPLLRATLIRLAQDEHVLLVTMHHIVSDGWSIGVLLAELTTLYAALSREQPSPLPDLPMQYSDFAEWQRQWLTGETLERQLSYWRKQLGKLPPPLELPTNRPHSETRSYLGNTYRFVISRDATAKLRRMARENKASLFMALLAAWQVLLHRYSGQPDILIGTAIANRNRREFENLIGFFVNTLVLRADLSGGPGFVEVLRRARETSLGAQEHQDLPFMKLVSDLGHQQKPHENPFFKVMLNWLNLPASEVELAGLKWEQLEQTVTVNRFDLMLTIFESQAELPALFEYSSNLFDESTIARLAGHLHALATAIVSNPQQNISTLAFLSNQEMKQLLIEWAGKKTKYPRESSVCELFEQEVEQTPQAVALVFLKEKLSYRELNCKANQLAHHLQSNGIQIEDRVAVYMDRSAEAVITLLGILKSGAAYVALDPAYPVDRIAFILANTKAKFLITSANLAKNLPDTLAVKKLCMDQKRLTIAQASSSDLRLQLLPDNLAYVAYTSGSTGVPKGVAISHRAVIRLVRGNDYVRLGPGETLLQFAPFAFDASTFEIWGCLLNGGNLAVAPPGAAAVEELGKLLRQHEVTTAWLTAGLFHWMVDHQLDALRAVPQLLAGGDVLSKSHVMKFLAAATEQTVLINGYGPTENTTFTCCQAIKKDDQFTASIPVGKPLANTQVYVLDPQMQPVPLGVPGELFIGGDGLARGYWEQPDLTAEKFIPDCYSLQPGERLYRSGDRMRWLADGRLEFLGRMDNQIKIRGYRVELAEIEAVLDSHSQVREAAVLAETQPSGEKKLIAYFSARMADAVTAEELRQFLQTKLPDYMTPSALIPVKGLPLTANGKVDRKALAAFDISAPPRNHIAPRTAAEKVVAQIWSEVVERTGIGVEDSFFELGGHSLQATQIILRLREAFQVDDLPLRRLFESPTVVGLVNALKEHYDPETLEIIAETLLEAQDLPPETSIVG